MFIPNTVIEKKIDFKNEINQKLQKLDYLILLKSMFLEVESSYSAKLFKIRLLKYINNLSLLPEKEQKTFLGEDSTTKIKILKNMYFYKKFNNEVGHLLNISQRSVIKEDAAKVVSSLHSLLNQPYLDSLKIGLVKDVFKFVFSAISPLLPIPDKVSIPLEISGLLKEVIDEVRESNTFSDPDRAKKLFSIVLKDKRNGKNSTISQDNEILDSIIKLLDDRPVFKFYKKYFESLKKDNFIDNNYDYDINRY
ncbi:hypothetical protein [Mycoplasma sp. 1012]